MDTCGFPLPLFIKSLKLTFVTLYIVKNVSLRPTGTFSFFLQLGLLLILSPQTAIFFQP